MAAQADLLKASTNHILEAHPNAQNIRVLRTIKVGEGLFGNKLTYLSYEDIDANDQRQNVSCVVYNDSVHDPRLFNNVDEFITWYSGRRLRKGFWPQVLE